MQEFYDLQEIVFSQATRKDMVICKLFVQIYYILEVITDHSLADSSLRNNSNEMVFQFVAKQFLYRQNLFDNEKFFPT